VVDLLAVSFHLARRPFDASGSASPLLAGKHLIANAAAR
jgi:hypothetical protein